MNDRATKRKDIFWKAIIEVMIRPFMYFFFPAQAHMIDFSKDVRFLDKEFNELFPEISEDAKGRRADKLVELALKGGGTVWILVHIEVQGYVDPDFARRMFEYYYRILEKYGKRVTAIAIFTDDSPSFHPTEYCTELWGTELVYRYNTYKLLDKTLADFADADNPLSIVMETAWYELKRNKLDDESLSVLKFRLIRRLYQAGYPKHFIFKILYFITFYLKFDKEESHDKFINELTPILKSNKMTLEQLIYKENKKFFDKSIMENIDVIAGEMAEELAVPMAEELAVPMAEELAVPMAEELAVPMAEELAVPMAKEIAEEMVEKKIIAEREKAQILVETNSRELILKLQKQGFTKEQISTFLEMPLEEILRLIALKN